MARKSEAKGKKSSTVAGVDDRHLPHPHATAVDPAGGAVFGDTASSSPAGGADAACPKAEKPTADGDPDAIGYVVLEDCPDPDDQNDSAGGDGVGAVVRDDCHDADGRPAADATVAPQSQSAVGASDATAGSAMGGAVLPDGRVAGDAGQGGDIREGYGLVFSS
jgi:hypothetical protein